MTALDLELDAQPEGDSIDEVVVRDYRGSVVNAAVGQTGLSQFIDIAGRHRFGSPCEFQRVPDERTVPRREDRRSWIAGK